MAPRSLVVTTAFVMFAAIGAGAWWGTNALLDVTSGRAAAQAKDRALSTDAGAEAPVGADASAPVQPPATNPDGTPVVADPTAPTPPPEPLPRQTLTGIEVSLAEALVPADLPKMAEGRSYRMRPEPDVPRQETVPPSDAPPPVVSAERAVVMDARTGALLWGKEEELAVSVASTFKMLTALVALRWSDPAESVTVGENATVRDQSRIDRRVGLVPGEQVSVKDLLGVILVGSANDASIALGDFVSGGNQDLYNEAAEKLATRLGARETTVRNATGLDQRGQFSTAYDLAVMARAGLADPLFREIVQSETFRMESAAPPSTPGSTTTTTKSRSGPTTSKSDSGSREDEESGTSGRTVENRNPLLGEYEGAIGVKTGSTALAGDCLVAAATRDGRTYIAVVLKSKSPGDDSKAMLDWAFENWATAELAERRTELVGADGAKGVPAVPVAVSVPAGTEGKALAYVTAESIEVDYDGLVLASVPRVRSTR